MQRRVGFHVSIAGGLAQAVERAAERRCTAFQIFCGSPRAWKLGNPPAEDVAAFRDACRQADMRPLVVHACYLINPCSRDAAIRRRSTRRLARELRLAADLGAEHYVLHPGSHKGMPLDWGVARAANSIARAVQSAGRHPRILLESMASPHGPGGSFAGIGRVVHEVTRSEPQAKLGLAIDSCHVFAAGYDLRETAEVARLASDIDGAVGLNAVHLIHLNDARDEAGTRRDRHAHLGKGCIGLTGLGNLLHCPPLAHVPLIMETPWESLEQDLANMAVLRELLDEQPPSDPGVGLSRPPRG
jgi:deoxyribonuclease-4